MATAAPQVFFRCLIVDDADFHRVGLERVIKKTAEECQCPCICDCVESGPEALKMCSQHDYNIIILDYHMGDMNGAEAAKRILALRPGCHIIGFTASQEHFNDCLNAGMREVYPKDWIRVKEAIKKLMKPSARTSIG